jgi:NitT/TauT family transport system permease protein
LTKRSPFYAEETIVRESISHRTPFNANILRRSRFLVGFVVLFMLWEVSVHLTGVKEYVLPPPVTVFDGFREQWPKLLSNAWITTIEIVAGYALAIAVSIPLALLIAFSRIAEETVYPVVVFLQIIPKIAVAPLFIIWLGFGFMPKLLLVFLLSFFPIVVSGIAGFKSINPEIVDFVKTTGATALRTFFKVRLPHALPEIFTGLKVGAALSTTAAVVAEFVASDRGLGYLLLQYNGDLNTRMVFATIILLSVIGVAIYFLAELLERILIPWRAPAENHVDVT